MNLLQNLLRIVEKARANKTRLNREDTLQILRSVKNISADPWLLEKIITIVFFSKNVPKIKNLSKRQTQIFKLIGLGFSSREIGDLLEISEATVSTHRKQMIKKLGLSGAGKLHILAMQYIHIQIEN